MKRLVVLFFVFALLLGFAVPIADASATSPEQKSTAEIYSETAQPLSDGVRAVSEILVYTTEEFEAAMVAANETNTPTIITVMADLEIDAVIEDLSVITSSNLTIRGTAGVPPVLSYEKLPSGVAFYVTRNANVRFENITLQGANSAYMGLHIMGGTATISDGVTITGFRGPGVQIMDGSVFTMTGGEISGNSFSGVFMVDYFFSSAFIMEGGIISGNSASNMGGGGVFVNSRCKFIMTGGEISDNTADENGGGVSLNSMSEFHMSGGVISGNTAGGNGGGVFMHFVAELHMSGGVISNNTAVLGGGIYVNEYATLNITGGSSITGNSAQSGGGIFATNYTNLTIDNSIIFDGNKASTMHDFGESNRRADIEISEGGRGNPKNIDWATVSIQGTHALNNFDINYTGGDSLVPPQPQMGTTITKILRLPEGTSIPNATFNFNATSVSVDGDTNEAGPELTNLTVSFSPTTSGASSSAGIVSIEVATGNIFEGVNFPHAGVFVYEITEQSNTNPEIDNSPNEQLTYSNAKYRLEVYVVNTEGGIGTSIYAVSIFNITQDTEQKVDKMTFINDYVKTTPVDPSSGDSTLFISKWVTGDFANKQQYFDFTINIAVPSILVNPPAYYRAYIVDTDGSVSADYIQVSTTTATTFRLRDGQRLIFIDIPIGTSYVVEEAGTADYFPSAIVTTNGMPIATSEAGIGASLSTGTQLVGEENNGVVFTNRRDTVTDTGLNLNDLPFIILIAIGLTATVIFIMVKIRKRGWYI